MFRKVFKRHSAGDIYLLVMVHTALILSTAACSICLAELPHTRTSAIAGNEEREIWLLSSRKAVVRFKRPTAEARKEWEESAIASDIIDENLISVPDMAYLPGTSRLVYPLLDLLGLESSFRSGGYEPSWDRIGWTYRGYDPLTDAEASTFEIKPIPAIRKYEVGPSKYEHTAVNPRMAFLRMTRWRANSILRSPIGEQCQDPTLCFWRAVKDSSIPVIVTEGAKKAGSLLSAGYAALSIPGTCRGMNFIDDDRKKLHLSLIADLVPFIKRKRTYFFSFDNDVDPKLVKLIDTSIYYLGKLLTEKGNQVRVIILPGPEKGADDFIHAHGPEAYKKLFDRATTFQSWLAEKRPILTLAEFFSNKWCANPCDIHC